jgi:hypothetical protein
MVDDHNHGDSQGGVAAINRRLERRQREWRWQCFTRDVLALNKTYAVVTLRGKARILKQVTTEDGRPDFELMSADDFRLENSNRTLVHPGQERHMPIAGCWLDHAKRRQYKGICFAPGRRPRGWFNSWTGWGVRPKPGSCELFKAHLHDNVCQGDADLFVWLWSWMAQAVQQPEKPPGIAVVLRGRPGVGKTKVGEIFGALFGVHYLLADNAKHVTGRHNAHLERALLLQVDDATVTGDAEVESRLKGIITGRKTIVEPKGIDAYEAPNFVRVLLTSDQEWSVPVGMDDRRYAVFDVGDARRLDRDYFAAIDKEAAAGGLGALLYELQRARLEGIDVRQAPRTAALTDQKLRSLRPEEAWWRERLYFGAQLRGGTWQRWVPADKLYDDYAAAADRRGVRSKTDEVEFGLAMRRLCPHLQRRKRCRTEDPDTAGIAMGKRAWGYELGTLQEARQAFERAIGQPLDWLDDED